MKVSSKLIFTSMLLSSVLLLSAQVSIEVKEGMNTMSQGEFNAYMISIPQIESKTFEKNWEKWLKDGSKSKVEKSNDEINITGALNKRISTEPMDIYSRYYETETGLELVSFFKDDGGFISSENNHEKASAIKKVLKEFGEDMYRLAVEKELDEENSALSKLEKELDKLIKDNEKMHKDISSYKREIERTKKEIGENKNDQERKSKDIELQKDVVHKLRDALEEQREEADDRLKELEKERKKMIRDNEKMHKEIDNLEAKIRERERDIVKNEEEQKLKNLEITSQKEVILSVKNKLKAI